MRVVYYDFWMFSAGSIMVKEKSVGWFINFGPWLIQLTGKGGGRL